MHLSDSLKPAFCKHKPGIKVLNNAGEKSKKTQTEAKHLEIISKPIRLSTEK